MTSSPRDPSFDYRTFIGRNAGKATIVDFAANEVIYAQGGPADALYYVIEGTVKVSVLSETGREGVIALLGPGSFFGEGCLDRRPTHATSITTTNACKVVRLHPEAVSASLTSDAAFAKVFFAFLLGRAEKLEADLIDQLFNSSEKRLARILLTLANAGGAAKPSAIGFPVNQEVLASMVGTTRSRINQFMNKFRKLGYIEYDGEIRVHDSLVNIILNRTSDPVP